jgi:hypothetical protein
VNTELKLKVMLGPRQFVISLSVPHLHAMATLFDDKPEHVIDLSIGAPSRDLMPISMMAAACHKTLSRNEDAWHSFQVNFTPLCPRSSTPRLTYI